MPLHREKNVMISIAAGALSEIFKEKSTFVTASVMDILFNGVGSKQKLN